MSRLFRWMTIHVLAIVLVTTMGLGIVAHQAARAASTLTVTTTADTAPPCKASAFSLRCAVTKANADGSGDTITFNIPSKAAGCSGTPAVCTIKVTSPLPAVTASNTTINGYTQASAHPNTNSPGAGDNAVLTIVLDGARAGLNGIGIQVTGSGDTIRGLAIINFQFDGVDIEASGVTGDIVAGDFIGVRPNGTTPAGNQNGVVIRAGGVTLGGTTPDAVNVISGNTSEGVFFNSFGLSNVIEGNLIGTTAAGTAALGNGSFAGVDIGGSNILVGGTTSGARNVISGNYRGIFIRGGSTSNTVEGNYLGTNVTGTAALGNTIGVDIEGGSNNNTIGGTSSGARNVISGNTIDGLFIRDSSGNVVQGNYIGTDLTGTRAIGNGALVQGSAGIVILAYHANVSDTLIGGTTSAARNVISGNPFNGINLSPTIGLAFTMHNHIEGNFIGTDATGTQALGNGKNGVFITNGSLGDSITNNVISRNGQSGVLVGSSSADTTIHSAINQNAMFANGGLGIDLAPQGTVNCTTSPPGPNDYPACPVIKHATTSLVSGTACTNCTIEVFIASNEADDQGHGEGQTFLGSATADASGNWSLILSIGQVSSGQPVTAAATTRGTPSTPAETSEFAANIVVAS